MSTNRQERRKQQTRQKLLDAARRLISSRGYEATDVLDITEAADVSKSTFYLYFKDKEDLTRALIMAGFDDLHARIDAVLSDGVGPPQVGETLRAAFHYAAENRDVFRIMLGSRASAELSLLAFNYYAAVLEENLARAELAARVVALPGGLLAQFVAGAVVRLATWWLEDDHGLSADEMGDITYRLLTEGVLNKSFEL